MSGRTKPTDPCPQCGVQLSFTSEVGYGLGVHHMPYCEECHWKPGAVRVPCECGCGRMGYRAGSEFNHPEDFKHGERGCS